MPVASRYARYDGFTFRPQSEKELQIITDELMVFSQLAAYRNQGFAYHWEEVSELIAPNYRNTFMYGSYNTPGMKKTDRQIDSTGMMCLRKFAAICDSLLTPRNLNYQHLRASNSDLMKQREVAKYFDNATKILFRHRNAPEANFSSQNQANFRMLGAFGNLNMLIEQLDDPEIAGLRYIGVPLGQMFYRTNHQNRVCGFTRWYRMTANQAHQRWPGMLPPGLHSSFERQSEQIYNFLHCVYPREDWEPGRLDARGKRWRSIYISIEGRCAMFQQGNDFEGGYRSFPLAAGRYDQGVDEVYGRGIGMDVLPSLKTLNAQKRMFLKQGHRAADPVLLTFDDGIVGMSLRPGAMNPGGVNADGKLLVQTLPTGQIQTSLEMMQEERDIIRDGFFVQLLQLLEKTPQMSATEVVERANEKGILLAPTIGRQQDEYLAPMTDRELDLLVQQRLLPPPPPALVEAKGEYHVIYDNPISRMAKSGMVAGYMRTLETASNITKVTGDGSPLDRFDVDTALPEIADLNAVPTTWMASDSALARKRKMRQQVAAEDAATKKLPYQAAMVKANAVAAKSGTQPNATPPPPVQQQQPQQQLQGPGGPQVPEGV